MKNQTGKVLAALFIASISSAAMAETFSCGFAEPWYGLSYDTATQRLTLTDSVTQEQTTLEGVRFVIAGPAQFVLRSAAGAELAKINLTGNASDGASETKFPYEIRTSLVRGPNGGVGTCESSEILAPTNEQVR